MIRKAFPREVPEFDRGKYNSYVAGWRETVPLHETPKKPASARVETEDGAARGGFQIMVATGARGFRGVLKSSSGGAAARGGWAICLHGPSAAGQGHQNSLQKRKDAKEEGQQKMP